MKICTKYFGEIELQDSDIFNFPKGIFGFEDNKKYVIVPFDANDDSLLCMQSTEDEMLAFILMDPFRFIADYAPKIAANDLNALEANADTKLNAYAIVVVHDSFADSTINLKCPVIVNTLNRTAIQVILDDYSMKYPISNFNKED